MKRILIVGLCMAALIFLSFNCVYAEGVQTLTLTENWTITENLDLNVPYGTTLIVDGSGLYYIYEMGGKLINTGGGRAEFENTILYPLDNDTDAKNVYVDNNWDADESARLLLERIGIHSDKGLEYSYSVTNDADECRYEISMSSEKDVRGTFIVALYDNNHKLIGIDISAMDAEGKSYTIPMATIANTQEATTYKILFWRTFDNLTPICKAVEGRFITE